MFIRTPLHFLKGFMIYDEWSVCFEAIVASSDDPKEQDQLNELGGLLRANGVKVNAPNGKNKTPRDEIGFFGRGALLATESTHYTQLRNELFNEETILASQYTDVNPGHILKFGSHIMVSEDIPPLSVLSNYTLLKVPDTTQIAILNNGLLLATDKKYIPEELSKWESVIVKDIDCFQVSQSQVVMKEKNAEVEKHGVEVLTWESNLNLRTVTVDIWRTGKKETLI